MPSLQRRRDWNILTFFLDWFLAKAEFFVCSIVAFRLILPIRNIKQPQTPIRTTKIDAISANVLHWNPGQHLIASKTEEKRCIHNVIERQGSHGTRGEVWRCLMNFSQGATLLSMSQTNKHLDQWWHFKTRSCKQRLHKSRYYGLLRYFGARTPYANCLLRLNNIKPPIQINSVLSRRLTNPNIICEDSIGFWNLSPSIEGGHTQKTTSNQFPGMLGTLTTVTIATILKPAKSIVEFLVTSTSSTSNHYRRKEEKQNNP